MRKKNDYQIRQHMVKKDYELFYYKDQQMNNVSLHHHDFFEVYFFIDGEVYYQIEGRNYHLSPGDILLVNHKELHQALIETKDHVYERYVLWVNQDYLKGLSTIESDLTRCFLDEEKKTLLKTSLEHQQLVRSILDKLRQLENYKGIGKDILPDVYMSELMIALNQMSFHKEEILEPQVKKNQLIESIMAYINEHLVEDLKIDDLADAFFISKYHLSREFKKYTGTTLYRYVVQKRLILAKDLILMGHPITTVFSQCGFGDYSNFFRAFKNEYAMTPKNFLKTMEQHQANTQLEPPYEGQEDS